MKRMLFSVYPSFIFRRKPDGSLYKKGRFLPSIDGVSNALFLFLKYLESLKSRNNKALILVHHGGNDLEMLLLNLAYVGQLGRFLSLVEEFCDFQAVVGKF